MYTDPTAPIAHARLSPLAPVPRGGFAEGGDDPRAGMAEGELTFGDVLQAINPLHHLPVIGNVYRELTGEKLAPMARIVGGGLFGGVFGALAAIGNAVVEALTGKDVGGQVVALFDGGAGNRTATAATPQSRAYGQAAALARPDLSRGDTVNLLG